MSAHLVLPPNWRPRADDCAAWRQIAPPICGRPASGRGVAAQVGAFEVLKGGPRWAREDALFAVETDARVVS